MTLHMIGLGLSYADDMSVRSLNILQKCEHVYVEGYTSILSCTLDELSNLIGKKVVQVNRKESENDIDIIIKQALNNEIAFCVIGDPLSATTHTDIIAQAKETGVETKVYHNASVFTAIASAGLQLYKYGKTTSIPFLSDIPNLETPYRIIEQNLSIGAHTLCLLDIKPPRFMHVKEAIETLYKIQERTGESVLQKDQIFIGCARLGWDKQIIVAGTKDELCNFDFGSEPHCLIVPGNLHFLEEEFIRSLRYHD